MSKRFYFDEFSEDIFDDEIQQYPSNQTICNILNQQQKRIAELEEQLKNAIVLPISVEQEIYCVYETDINGNIDYTIDKGYISTISKDVHDVWFYGIYDSGLTYWHLLQDFNNEVFTTKEEAQAKLEELKGE
ncbi:hypothetical protein IJE86_08030 [bacterium]|nr:hypothetical protein [bacterium]